MHKFLLRSLGIYFFIAMLGIGIPETTWAANSSSLAKFQNRIIDYRHHLNKKFKKEPRKKTRYIIVHTSELGTSATLRVVSKGKTLNSGYRTPGGHAHYVITRNGETYRILNKEYRADHAGLSMWDNQENISDISIGIELVGYHNSPLTDQQYRSVSLLLHILKKIYSLPDKNILTHSQIAYGKPNPWFKKNHRGRKRCAQNFDREKAGLKDHWHYDPDVRAGRLLPDPELSVLFYQPQTRRSPAKEKSNIITPENSAWSIAGEKYDLPSTIYVLPDGKKIKGNRVSTIIGWENLPTQTKILLNQNLPGISSKSPIKIIKDGATAWSYAGSAYNSKHTFYILPSGKIIIGSNIPDWDDLPAGTRLISNYKGPYLLTAKKTAFSLAGFDYQSRNTIYYIPPDQLRTGDKIEHFDKLPKGTKLFLPLASFEQ